MSAFEGCVIILAILLFAVTKADIPIASTNDCLEPNVTISQSIRNDGFHKDVEIIVDLKESEEYLVNNCRFSVKVFAGNGFFINPDEMQELIRMKKISAIVDNNVDIEAPAHEAIGHEAHFFIEPNKIMKIEYGIHLRYHRSQILGGYIQIPLKNPLLLIQCPRGICGESVNAPCDEKADAECIWKNINYKGQFSHKELRVPVGDLDDYPLVAIVSLSLGCAGTLYLLSLLDATLL